MRAGEVEKDSNKKKGRQDSDSDEQDAESGLFDKVPNPLVFKIYFSNQVGSFDGDRELGSALGELAKLPIAEAILF